VPDAWLAHTSALSWEHISLSGDFLWEQAAAINRDGRGATEASEVATRF
jgi:hypothetical protein